MIPCMEIETLYDEIAVFLLFNASVIPSGCYHDV